MTYRSSYLEKLLEKYPSKPVFEGFEGASLESKTEIPDSSNSKAAVETTEETGGVLPCGGKETPDVHMEHSITANLWTAASKAKWMVLNFPDVQTAEAFQQVAGELFQLQKRSVVGSQVILYGMVRYGHCVQVDDRARVDVVEMKD